MKSTTSISKIPKILHVVNALNRGGIETWLIRLLQEIDRKKFAIDICCRERELGCLSRHALDAGAQVRHVPWEPTGILYGPRFKKFLHKHQYDLLHTHVPTSCGIETVAAASLGIPAVFTGHGCSPVSQNKIVSLPGIRQIRRTLMNRSLRSAIELSSYVTAVSEGALSHLTKYSPRTDRWQALRLGVEIPPDLSTEKKGLLRKEFGLLRDTPLVIHVARFCPEKNHAGVIRIFENICDVIPNAKLLLVGDGPLRKLFQSSVQQSRHRSAITFTGIRTDVLDLLSIANVFLFPSISEGLGAACLEAGAAGLPVIASDIPGLNETVVHQKTGELHPVTHEVAMAESACHFLRNQEYAKSIGRNARTYVLQNYSIKRSGNQLCDIYESALRKNDARKYDSYWHI